MPSDRSPVIQMSGITRRYPGVIANDHVDLAVGPGEVHAVIGENGAGKTTLMSILYGRVQPDEGRIRVHGAEVVLQSPADAIRLGIAMVTQHTTLIPVLTGLENVMLGAETGRLGVLDRRSAHSRAEAIARRVGLADHWDVPVGHLSVASRQKIEIVKALYRAASVIILDEPTAMLGPHEAASLFDLVHSLTSEGASILLVTHKLREVMDHTEYVTVMRAGRTVFSAPTSSTSRDELLAHLMDRSDRASAPVGAASLSPPEPPTAGAFPALLARAEPVVQSGPNDLQTTTPAPVLEVTGLTVTGDRGVAAVSGASLAVGEGEILGIAGVDGSGQLELAEAILGLRAVAGGAIHHLGDEITHLATTRRMARGIAYVPEDRQRHALVMGMSVEENLLLGRQRSPRYGGGAILSLSGVRRMADSAIRNFSVRTSGPEAMVADLSGGNQQRVVIARSLSGEPSLLVAMQPTRGLDAVATAAVYAAIRQCVGRRMAAIIFSLDLDEILEVATRIAVMFQGRIVGIVPRAEATTGRIGAMMVGASEGSDAT